MEEKYEKCTSAMALLAVRFVATGKSEGDFSANFSSRLFYFNPLTRLLGWISAVAPCLSSWIFAAGCHGR